MEYFSLFGGSISQEHQEKYAQSAQWDGKRFANLEETVMEFSWANLPELMRKQFFDRENREPEQPIPILPFNKSAFLNSAERAQFIWYGHSVVLLRMAGKTLLIDPMLGDNASPIAPFATKRFTANTLDIIDDFPEIDLVLMTHDHYDHLDYHSIKKLEGKAKHYFVALGVGRHLESWGVPKASITEFDWWQQQSFEGIDITFTPTRHFSGRGLTDRAKSLWGGWTFKTEKEHLYFSGDGGFGKHFEEVGKRLGPFDFAWMECGQYNKNWHQIHMYPEESVLAATQVDAKKAMPVHWAGFALALHTWTDPVERFVEEATNKNLPILHPRIGELVDYGKHESTKWWQESN